MGGITPAVLVTLNSGEKVLAAHEIMLYKEPTVKLERRSFKQLGVSRMHMMGLGALGDNEEAHFFAEFEGPGHVSFSRDKGGEVRVFPLPPGQSVRLKSGHLICFDPSVRYMPMVLAQFRSLYPDSGGNYQMNYMFADELTGPGTLVFQSYGNILSFDLKPGEVMRTGVESLLAVANTVGLNINWLQSLQGAGMVGTQNVAFPVVDLTGPGRVMVHSGI